MYTQCQHCQAIFSVSMREVTVAKGKVRCGECHDIFDASKTLSTSKQKRFVTIDINEPQNEDLKSSKAINKKQEISAEELKTIKALDSWQTSPSRNDDNGPNSDDFRKSPISLSKTLTAFTKKQNSKKSITRKDVKPKTIDSTESKSVSKWGLLTAGLLSLLLMLQLAYNYRHLLLDNKQYAPNKIQMLNHNVFAHPIENGALLISASIENTANFEQPFPHLEVKLSNGKSELVALRRFSPQEYLDGYSKNTLLPIKKPTSIKLKIRDPGNQATRFQFNFL